MNVAAYSGEDPDQPFLSRHGPSYRGLYDLAEPDRSLFVAATGQSGHPLSRHYRDLTGLWQAGQYLPMSTLAGDYEEGAEGRLRLVPVTPPAGEEQNP